MEVVITHGQPLTWAPFPLDSLEFMRAGVRGQGLLLLAQVQRGEPETSGPIGPGR